MNKCKNCDHWWNNQKQLDYISDYGICEGLSEFGEAERIGFLPDSTLDIDFNHLSDGHRIKNWLMSFVTHEDFGCNDFKKRK